MTQECWIGKRALTRARIQLWFEKQDNYASFGTSTDLRFGEPIKRKNFLTPSRKSIRWLCSMVGGVTVAEKCGRSDLHDSRFHAGVRVPLVCERVKTHSLA